MSLSFEDRFWAKVQGCERQEACWEWKGSSNDGYGIITLGKRRLMAHRVSWELAGHPPADHRDLKHRCGNSLCVNPQHLELGNVKPIGRGGARGMKKLWVVLGLICGLNQSVHAEVWSTQRLMAELPRGSHIVFLPGELDDFTEDHAHDLTRALSEVGGSGALIYPVAFGLGRDVLQERLSKACSYLLKHPLGWPSAVPSIFDYEGGMHWVHKILESAHRSRGLRTVGLVAREYLQSPSMGRIVQRHFSSVTRRWIYPHTPKPGTNGF